MSKAISILVAVFIVLGGLAWLGYQGEQQSTLPVAGTGDTTNSENQNPEKTRVMVSSPDDLFDGQPREPSINEVLTGLQDGDAIAEALGGSAGGVKTQSRPVSRTSGDVLKVSRENGETMVRIESMLNQ